MTDLTLSKLTRLMFQYSIPLCHLVCDSKEAYENAFLPHAGELPVRAVKSQRGAEICVFGGPFGPDGTGSRLEGD
jgi:hypothetical protein